MRDPPQMCPEPLPRASCRLTIHGQAPGWASLPPTTRDLLHVAAMGRSPQPLKPEPRPLSVLLGAGQAAGQRLPSPHCLACTPWAPSPGSASGTRTGRASSLGAGQELRLPHGVWAAAVWPRAQGTALGETHQGCPSSLPSQGTLTHSCSESHGQASTGPAGGGGGEAKSWLPSDVGTARTELSWPPESGTEQEPAGLWLPQLPG